MKCSQGNKGSVYGNRESTFGEGVLSLFFAVTSGKDDRLQIAQIKYYFL